MLKRLKQLILGGAALAALALGGSALAGAATGSGTSSSTTSTPPSTNDGGPPPGFKECHSTLNKDGPDTPRGSQPVAGTNKTMYDLAALLATRATTDLYRQLRDLVASTNGQDAATALFQQG